MKTFDNQLYLLAYIISNALAILFFIIALKYPKTGRLLFFVLFGWASWANWNMVLNKPDDYLHYADFAFVKIYKDFILGWFTHHIQLTVGVIATCQALIAISMLLRGWIYQSGVICGIIFLLAIIPLGIGSAFPCTLMLAIALGLLKAQDQYLWKRPEKRFIMNIR